MNYDDNITFSINQVAKMLGVVSATIRNWEKNGLITARRSQSNYRVFTLGDIEILKKIKEYSVEKHMSAEAIKLLLPVSKESGLELCMDQQQESFYSKTLLSAKWKEIREQRGFTLDEVSRAVGISAAHLSKLENGNANISLEILDKLAQFYQESPLHPMQETASEHHLVHKGCGEELPLADVQGVRMISLIAQKDHIMYPVLCEVEPGCGSLTPHTHNGEDLIYMLSGMLEITLNDDPPYLLRQGDTFFYRGSDVHCWRNVSGKIVRMLWIHSALTKQ